MTKPEAQPTAAVAKVPQKLATDLTQALVIKDKHGEIRQIRTKTKLSVKDGTLVKMGNMQQTDEATGQRSALFVVSAQGFIELAGKCGIVALPTPTLTVNGAEVPNPYPDPVTGKVYARAVAIGYTALGQLVPVARTIVYDAKLANLQDLIAKANMPENSKFMQMWPLERDATGKLVRPEPLGPRWTGYVVDEAMALWVDCSCPKIMGWQREMRNREDKAIRTCETFAARNAIASHPGCPRQRKFAVAESVVECTTWFAATGTMRFGKEMLSLDPNKLLAEVGEATGAPIQVDDRTEDLNDTATVKEIDGSDADETTVVDDDDDPLEAVDPANEAKEGSQGTGEGEDTPKTTATPKTTPPEAPQKGVDAEKVDLIAEITAREKKIGVRGPVKRARMAVGLTIDTNLADLDIKQLNGLLEYYEGQG